MVLTFNETCEICRQSPCAARCSNAARHVKKECLLCGGEIGAGEAYYENRDFGYKKDFAICEDCIGGYVRELFARKMEEE